MANDSVFTTQPAGAFRASGANTLLASIFKTSHRKEERARELKFFKFGVNSQSLAYITALDRSNVML